MFYNKQRDRRYQSENHSSGIKWQILKIKWTDKQRLTWLSFWLLPYHDLLSLECQNRLILFTLPEYLISITPVFYWLIFLNVFYKPVCLMVGFRCFSLPWRCQFLTNFRVFKLPFVSSIILLNNEALYQ